MGIYRPRTKFTIRDGKLTIFQKDKKYKKKVNYTINKHLIDRVKVFTDKDMRKMSNIVENLIRRCVESRV